jgi:hypothetical protein
MTRHDVARVAWLVVLVVCSAVTSALAGPPFQTDDPEPIDFRNYEFYAFTSLSRTALETNTVGPAAEFNWGALPNVHLHVIVPLAAFIPSNSPDNATSALGLGDIETGIKFRFVQETPHRPQIGTFVMFELPTGNAGKGLGVGSTWYKVPLWAQKSFGPWTTYGGGGETIFSGSAGQRNYPFAGGLVQRDLGKKVTLGSEVFYHGAQGALAEPGQSATLVDVGGYYKFRDPGYQLLFCYGHDVAGQREQYAYAGLYWTWGHKDAEHDKDSDTAMNRFAPPERW